MMCEMLLHGGILAITSGEMWDLGPTDQRISFRRALLAFDRTTRV